MSNSRNINKGRECYRYQEHCLFGLGLGRCPDPCVTIERAAEECKAAINHMRMSHDSSRGNHLSLAFKLSEEKLKECRELIEKVEQKHSDNKPRPR